MLLEFMEKTRQAQRWTIGAAEVRRYLMINASPIIVSLPCPGHRHFSSTLV